MNAFQKFQTIREEKFIDQFFRQQKVINFLKKPGNLRTNGEIEKIFLQPDKHGQSQENLLKHFMNLGIKGTQIKELLKKMKLEFFKADELVFKFNSLGEKVYFIIVGQVSVWVPTKTESRNASYRDA